MEHNETGKTISSSLSKAVQLSVLADIKKPIEMLLINLSGIEKVISNWKEEPLQELCTVVFDSAYWEKKAATRWAVSRISRLSVFNYRVSVDGVIWNPLKDSFQNITESGSSLDIWLDNTPSPTPSEIEKWIYCNGEQS